MFIKRALGAAAVAGVAVAATAIPAMAAPHTSTTNTKPAPSTSHVVPATAHAPTMYPAANKVSYHAGGVYSITCKKGWLCVDVWDPTKKTYKVFELYTCTTRNLSYFTNQGYPQYKNNQTTGTVTRFTSRTGGTLKTSKAPQGVTHINWDPVWHIKVC